MNPSDIQVSKVSKYFRHNFFRKKIAVQDLSFEIERGQVVGLIGPNGSGKSTTIKMILGFLKPDTGFIKICGKSPRDKQTRSEIGYLPENPRFQRFLTGKEILIYYGKLLGIAKTHLADRAGELLELVNLSHAQNEKTSGYSKGMIQRLAIAQSLLAKPRILIFDEPMSGVDPVGRIEIKRIISNVREQLKDTTIFFSTHILSDIEEVCTSVIVLKKGNLIHHTGISELLKSDTEHYEVAIAHKKEELTWLKPQMYGHINSIPLGFSVEVEGTDSLISMLSELKRSGARVISVTSRRVNLEQALFTENQKHPHPRNSYGETYMTRLFPIAWIAIRELIFERVFYILVFFVVFSLGISYLLGQMTYTDQDRLTLDFMLAAIQISMVLFSVFMGIALFKKEMMLGSAAMILSKPISRSTFVLGKFIGQEIIQFFLVLLMTIVTISTVYEGAQSDTTLLSVFQASFMIFLEVSILTSIAFLFAVNASAVTTAVVTLSFFALGHFRGVITKNLEKVMDQKWFWKAAKTFIPDLEVFNLKAVVPYGVHMAAEPFAWAFLYALCCIAFFMTITILLFNEKDILT